MARDFTERQAGRLPVKTEEGELHPQQGETRFVTARVTRHGHSLPFLLSLLQRAVQACTKETLSIDITGHCARPQR